MSAYRKLSKTTVAMICGVKHDLHRMFSKKYREQKLIPAFDRSIPRGSAAYGRQARPSRGSNGRR